MSISDQIREALVRAGISRYRIYKDLGISQAQLSRFVHGQSGLSMELLDQLADYLGLEIRSKGKRPAVKKRSR